MVELFPGFIDDQPHTRLPLATSLHLRFLSWFHYNFKVDHMVSKLDGMIGVPEIIYYTTLT